MRTPDLIRAALGGLWRQKARSALTLLGVAVGTAALAYTLALGVGLREFIETEFKSRREFWVLNVHPKNFGRQLIPEDQIPPAEIAVGDDIPADRRDRLRKRLIQDYQQQHPPKRFVLVSREQVAHLRGLPDVEEVRTSHADYAELTLGDARRAGLVYAGRLDDFEPSLDSHLLWGRLPNPAADEAVVSEFLLDRLGLKSDEQMRSVLGRKLRVTVGQAEFARGNTLAALLSPDGRREEVTRGQAEVLDRIVRQLPKHIDQFELSDFEKAAVKAVLSAKPKPADEPKRWGEERFSVSAEFTVVGVTRVPEVKPPDPTDLLAGSPLPPSEVFLPPAAEQSLFARIPRYDLGYPDVTVRVRPGGDVEGVANAVEGMGLESFNSLRFYHAVKREVTLISAGLSLFAVLSMVVAAIGIMNTLFTSVLERTREIGVLKAVGARDGHILWMFLLEGAAVGLVGGAIGLAVAYLVSIPSDGWVKSLIEQQRREEMLTKSYFGWPAWLAPAVLAFSVLLTTAAAVFPARRASRVPPVEALRHE
jgi:putative ABC transport system permease protein